MTTPAKRLVKAKKFKPTQDEVEDKTEDPRIPLGALDGVYYYLMFGRYDKLERIVEHFKSKHEFSPLKVFRFKQAVFAGPVGRIDLAPLSDKEKGDAIQELGASQVDVSQQTANGEAVGEEVRNAEEGEKANQEAEV